MSRCLLLAVDQGFHIKAHPSVYADTLYRLEHRNPTAAPSGTNHRSKTLDTSELQDVYRRVRTLVVQQLQQARLESGGGLCMS